MRIEQLLLDGAPTVESGRIAPDRTGPATACPSGVPTPSATHCDDPRPTIEEHPMISDALENIRAGRMQRLLAATAAATALPLGAEIWFEHYRGSFGDRWMWTPIIADAPARRGRHRRRVSERAPAPCCRVAGAVYASTA